MRAPPLFAVLLATGCAGLAPALPALDPPPDKISNLGPGSAPPPALGWDASPASGASGGAG